MKTIKPATTVSACHLCEQWLETPENESAYCLVKKQNKARNNTCESFKKWVP